MISLLVCFLLSPCTVSSQAFSVNASVTTCLDRWLETHRPRAIMRTTDERGNFTSILSHLKSSCSLFRYATCNGEGWVTTQIKGCLWLTCGLIILEMKADNELAISLPVYFKPVKKWKHVLKKQNDQEKRKKSFRRRESNPKPLTCKGNALSIAPRQPLLIIGVKLIMLNIFCPWNSAGGRCLNFIYEELKDIFEENKHGFDS